MEEDRSYKRAINELRKDKQADFLEELGNSGVPLSSDQLKLLLSRNRDIKKFIENSDDVLDATKFAKEDLGDEIKKPEWGNGKYRHSGTEVSTSDWMPKSVIYHEEDFVEWITSMNEIGFQEKSKFKKFEKYIEQAHNWLSENKRFEDYDDIEDKIEFFKEEFNRCKENSLYFCDKYLKLKDADIEDEGNVQYLAKPVHEVILYLADCGYSMVIGKPRQIAATTTFQGWAVKMLAFYKNLFIKFVTMDVDTAEEIMEDKLKYPVSQLPKEIRPSIKSDSEEGLMFGRTVKGKKGERGGANSKFKVVAPSVSAINAGAPDVVMVDEAGYIKVLGKMIRESRPTMFKYSSKTGKLVMNRQLIVWSTGGVDETNKRTKTRAFEEFVNHARDKWKNKEYEYGIVPVFFDWTTRPGITRKFYEQEKRNYTTIGPEAEQMMNQFRLTYPSRWEDMFLIESKTLLPSGKISALEDRIVRLPAEYKPTPGYFEPILDTTQVTTEQDDFGFKVIGAEFIPVEPGSDRATTWIFLHPEKGWYKRYFMGVDPIASDNGYSNMAATIWDKKSGTISAIFNYRDESYKYCYQQAFLLALYFNPEGVRENVPILLESNIGTAFRDYIDQKGYFNDLVYRTQLPDIFQGGNQIIGIDNRGMRNKFIINKMDEMFSMYGENFYFLILFAQLRTFVCTVNDKGTEIWGVSDKRRYQDDTLFSSVFAYICSECYSELPYQVKSETEKFITTYEVQMGPNGQLIRVPVKKRRFNGRI